MRIPTQKNRPDLHLNRHNGQVTVTQYRGTDADKPMQIRLSSSEAIAVADGLVDYVETLTASHWGGALK